MRVNNDGQGACQGLVIDDKVFDVAYFTSNSMDIISRDLTGAVVAFVIMPLYERFLQEGGFD